MQTLPNETLLEIFTYIDILGIIRNVSRVCKHWRSIARSPLLFYELNFSSGELGNQLSDTLFKKTIMLCPHVKTINMSRTHITGAGLEIISRSCVELQSLDLSFCVRLKSVKYDCLLSLPHLTKLNMLGTWKLSDPHLTSLVPFLDKGINLSLTIELMGSLPNFSPPQEETLFQQMLKLETIDLHLGHELARSFLDSPTLPLFSRSLISLEIGSRFTTASISQVPPQIGCLTSLRSLSIVSHTLQELPNEISKLTSLRSLLISSSRGYSTFSSLPPQITQLVHLESLNLCWNRMTELPSSIVNMTSLKRLNLSNNLLSQLPSELGQVCITLQYLSFTCDTSIILLSIHKCYITLILINFIIALLRTTC